MPLVLIAAHNISKRYDDGPIPVNVLVDANVSFNEGEVVGIFGASGAGKSTLLHLLGGLDRPTKGEVFFEGQSLSQLSDRALATLRNRSVGFVFQFYHLLSELTARENVMIPCLLAGCSSSEARERADLALTSLGLSSRADHHPGLLSGGEQQRVAIARAVVMRPKVIFADEPTGNLDRHTGDEVWKTIMTLAREYHMGLVVVSHNQELLATLPRTLELKDGRLVEAIS